MPIPGQGGRMLDSVAMTLFTGAGGRLKKQGRALFLAALLHRSVSLSPHWGDARPDSRYADRSDERTRSGPQADGRPGPAKAPISSVKSGRRAERAAM